MSSFIKVGLIGCGNIVTGHLHGFKILREHGVDNFRVTALCDQRITNAQMFRLRGDGPPQRRPLGLPWDESVIYVSDIQDDIVPEVYADWRDVVQSTDVDAVFILAPIFLHHSIALAALRAGKHVLTEKPFAITIKAGQHMISAAEARGLRLGIAEAIRYEEAVRTDHYVVDSGHLGAIQMFLCANMGAKGDQIFDQTPWRHQKLLAGGGFALDAGVHRFSQVRYLCGEIAQISAVARRNEPVRVQRDAFGQVVDRVESELEDAYFAYLEFENGAIGSIAEGLAGHGEAAGLKDGPTIFGTKGCLKGGELILDSGRRVSSRQVLDQEAPSELTERWFPHGIKDRFALEQLDFLRSIETGQPMETDAMEGMRDLACSFAVLESSALNRPVKVSDVRSGKIDTYQRPINEHYAL